MKVWTFAFFLGQVTAPLTPADALAAAHADLVRLPAEIRPHVRYLSGYQLTPAAWAKLLPVLAGHCNSLSREPDLTPPALAGARLVRVNLNDYGWSPKTWDKIVDPYFAATVEQTIETPWGYYDSRGRWIQTKVDRKTVKTQALAPWLAETPEARRMLADVVSWTQSKMPVVRADYFVNTTATAADGRLYYEFLGVANEKDFAKRVGSDPKAAADFGAIYREAVADSGVTLHPRAFVFTRSLGGWHYRSLDFNDNRDQKNPLRILGGDIEAKVDAVEAFAHLPNGLFAVGIFNGKGEAQATAPDNIASDHTSRSNDRRVHAGVSCFRCHAQGGLQDIDGWVAALLKAPLDLKSPDYDTARKLRREYARDLKAAIEDGRRTYETAIKQASGLSSKEYAAALDSVWSGYENARVDVARAAADLGTTPEKFRAALEREVRANRADTVLSPLLVGRTIPVKVFEESIPGAHAMLRGYQ